VSLAARAHALAETRRSADPDSAAGGRPLARSDNDRIDAWHELALLSQAAPTELLSFPPPITTDWPSEATETL
jgi:hypothetical protein